MRNNWNVEMGFMSEETFGHLLDSLKAVGRPLDITMMGIGEPLAHPRTIDMIAQLKAMGHTVKMVTNGTLLNEKRARGLIEAGLDVLWVSIDGATPENFADIRLGAYLPQILENIRRFRRLRRPAHHPVPEIGIAFVAMKRNINVCTFIESGAMAIGWNGNLAPCPPLVHTHTGYLQGYERTSIKHILGNIRDRSLLDVWYDPEYVAYRERVQQFAFAPCTSCGGCEIAWDNQTDCYSRPAPACGGCLWAQAVIQCP